MRCCSFWRPPPNIKAQSGIQRALRPKRLQLTPDVAHLQHARLRPPVPMTYEAIAAAAGFSRPEPVLNKCLHGRIGQLPRPLMLIIVVYGVGAILGPGRPNQKIVLSNIIAQSSANHSVDADNICIIIILPTAPSINSANVGGADILVRKSLYSILAGVLMNPLIFK